MRAIAGAYRRFGEFGFKIDFHGALTVLTLTTVPLAVHKVAAIAVHLAYRGLQVMHIAFDFAVHRIFRAVLPSAILPALALVAELPVAGMTCSHSIRLARFSFFRT